jgi:hypothetical protein
LKPIKIINFKKPISLIKTFKVKNIFAVVDEENTVRFYSLENFKVVGGIKTAKENHPIYNMVDISENLYFFLNSTKNDSSIFLWDIILKKLLQKFNYHTGEVYCVKFDKRSEYFLTAGSDGKVFLYSVKLRNKVLSLPPHTDYVLCADFSNDNIWVATSGYDKTINITNILSPNIAFKKKAHSSEVVALKFTNKKLISADKNGNVFIWNYYNGEILHKFEKLPYEIVDLAVDDDEDFLFVLCKNYIALYDLENYKLINERYIKIKEQSTSFAIKKDKLIVGTIRGSVEIFNLLQGEDELEKSLIQKDYKRAYELVEINPILKKSKNYLMLENLWKESTKKALSLLINDDRENAKKILMPFMNVVSKRGEIAKLFEDFKEFEKFKRAVANKNYPLAYTLASKYPTLKETVYFNKMEQEWIKLFNTAKSLLNKNARVEQIRELLKPFSGVSEKTPIIQAFINHRQIYELFKKKLSQKQFLDFFGMVGKYPFLANTPEYETALKYSYQLRDLAYESLKEGDYKKAHQIAQILKDIPFLKEEGEKIEKNAEIYSTFLSYLTAKRYDLVEELVKKYPFLIDTPEYKDMKKRIEKMLETIEKASVKGDVKSIKQIKNNFDAADLVKSKILQLTKMAYINQLDSQQDEKLKNRGIRNYLCLFGPDVEIDEFRKNKMISYHPTSCEFDELPDFIWEEI